MENLKSVIEASGSTLEKVVMVFCFLSDLSKFEEFNRVYARYFKQKPARITVKAEIPKGLSVEIGAIALGADSK